MSLSSKFLAVLLGIFDLPVGLFSQRPRADRYALHVQVMLPFPKRQPYFQQNCIDGCGNLVKASWVQERKTEVADGFGTAEVQFVVSAFDDANRSHRGWFGVCKAIPGIENFGQQLPSWVFVTLKDFCPLCDQLKFFQRAGFFFNRIPPGIPHLLENFRAERLAKGLHRRREEDHRAHPFVVRTLWMLPRIFEQHPGAMTKICNWLVVVIISDRVSLHVISFKRVHLRGSREAMPTPTLAQCVAWVLLPLCTLGRDTSLSQRWVENEPIAELAVPDISGLDGEKPRFLSVYTWPIQPGCELENLKVVKNAA